MSILPSMQVPSTQPPVKDSSRRNWPRLGLVTGVSSNYLTFKVARHLLLITTLSLISLADTPTYLHVQSAQVYCMIMKIGD